MDAHKHPGLASLVHLGAGQEIAAVGQAQAVAVSIVLSGIRFTADDSRVVLMAGGAPQAPDL